jgi:hypothetical protein
MRTLKLILKFAMITSSLAISSQAWGIDALER